MKIHDFKQPGLLWAVVILFCVSVLLAACSSGKNPSLTEASPSESVSLEKSSSESLPDSSEEQSIVLFEKPSSEPPSASKVPEQPAHSSSTLSFEPPSSSSTVPASAGVGFSYFDDAVFVGDSVSLKLQNYVRGRRQSEPGYMGKAQFLCSGSLGSGNALWDVSDKSVHPSYQGEKMKIENAVAKMGAKKVYIMLGMNDVAIFGVDGAVSNMGKLIDNIKAQSPNASIYIQSATPMIRDSYKNITNQKLSDYDNKLAALCRQKGYHFVDVASVMRDENGRLPASYCSDPDGMGLHFTDAACEVWVEYLRTHAV